jgi:Dimerisation domain
MSADPTADRIEQVAFGFMSSKVLFSGIEFGLFSELAKGPLDIEALKARLGLHPRSVTDFLDALVALGMLERLDECYSNTAESDFYLDRAKSSYIGNYFELWNARGYPFWGSLSEALKTGKPQNEIKRGEDVFEAVYATPDRLRLFLRSMTGHSLPSAMAIAEKFPWLKYKTFVDIDQRTAAGQCVVNLLQRRKKFTGLLMSLMMLIETQGGFDYTGADCQGWMREAGSQRLTSRS